MEGADVVNHGDSDERVDGGGDHGDRQELPSVQGRRREA